MNVGERITELRKARNLTTNKLANLSGVSQSYLRDVELGNKNPTVEFLSYICYGLGITLGSFFADSDLVIDPILLDAMRKLSTTEQRKLADFLEAMISNRK